MKTKYIIIKKYSSGNSTQAFYLWMSSYLTSFLLILPCQWIYHSQNYDHGYNKSVMGKMDSGAK